MEEVKRGRKRKSSIAPLDRPGRTRKARKAKDPTDTPATKKRSPTPRILSPIQIRVLDACFDPRCSTRADVAEVTGVREKTITGWIVEHPPFREEYTRRIQARGDELADLNVKAVRLALQFHIAVLSCTDNTFSVEDKFRSAKAILDTNRPRIDALNLQQVNIQNISAVNSGPSGMPAPSVPGSVRRLQGKGASAEDAIRQDADELILALEQLTLGATTVSGALDDFAAEAGVIDGDVVDG